MPFRNDSTTIKAAIESVLSQTWPKLELLLCNDHSNDGSRRLALESVNGHEKVMPQMIDSTGSGAAAARNCGIVKARGEFIAFLDADDLWRPDKIKKSVEFAMAQRLDMVGHSEIWLSSDGSESVVNYSDLVDLDVNFGLSVYRRNPFSTSATVIRRSLIERAGLFDEIIPSAEDYDYWLRLSLSPGTRAGFLNDALGVYRLRSGSESSRIGARHQAMLEIGERYVSQISQFSRSGNVEHWKFISRTYLSSGVRYFKGKERMRGALYVTMGLLQWPFRPEFVRWIRARLLTPRLGNVIVEQPE